MKNHDDHVETVIILSSVNMYRKTFNSTIQFNKMKILKDKEKTK